MKLRRSTRPFSLIEVLVALAIVSACAIPLLTPHFTIAKNQAVAIRALERELQAKKAFEEVREILYREPWWRKGTKIEGKLDNASYAVTIDYQYNKGRDQHRRTYRLLNIAINIDGDPVDYKLVAEKVRR